MADLSELNSSLSVKLAGAGPSTGIENNYATVDINGSLQVAGSGGAGSPAGGVLTVQGITSGTPLITKLSDGTDTVLISTPGDLYTRDVINVGGQNRAQSVTTSAAEALGAATILANRKVLMMTPTTGTIYWGFANTVTVASGTPIFKNQTFTLSVSDTVHVYIIAASAIDCRIAEGS